jgi:hypothetical protein
MLYVIATTGFLFVYEVAAAEITACRLLPPPHWSTAGGDLRIQEQLEAADATGPLVI